MKNSILTALLLLSSIVHAQDMKPGSSKTPAHKFPELSKVLSEDKTNELPYIVGQFTCHNFSKTLYLQRSTLVSDLAPYRIEAIKEDWGNEIVRSHSSKKLPIYILTMWNEESGFYHSINAVLIKPENPLVLDSYVFVEPQSDQIFGTTKEMYKHYQHYLKTTDTGKVLKISISNFTAFVFNGYINQSKDESLFNDQITF